MRPTLSYAFVRRTLARMKMLTEVDVENAAAAMAKMNVCIVDLVSLMDWLDLVTNAMRKTVVLRTCAECGEPIGLKLMGPGHAEVSKYRPDARYCSRKCRQKAYRKRVTAKAQPKKKSRNKDTSHTPGERINGNSEASAAP
jgi:hypothetical protein